jgi:hypothetical protein
MRFLDSNGVSILWNKIKGYVGEQTSGLSINWDNITNKPTWLQDGEVNWGDIQDKPSTFTPSAHNHAWTDITSGIPSGLVTTVNLPQGEGNVITGVTFSNHTLSFTKGNITPGQTTINWDDVEGKPANLVTNVSINNPGSFNAITNATFSGGVLTLTKGTISTSGSDGNNYPESVDLSLSGSNLTVTIKRNGLADISDTVTLPESGISQSTADGRYVKKAGDTMTGALTMIGTGGITFKSSAGGSTTGSFTPSGLTLGGENAGDKIQITGNSISLQGGGATITYSSTGLQINSNTNGTIFNQKITAPAFYEASDVALKENINIIDEDTIKKVGNISLLSFNFKDDKSKTTKYGVIAQEVEKQGLEELVNTDAKGVKSVDYISLLILKIEALEREIIELKSKVGSA